MKSIHKFFLSFLLVIIGLMGLSVVSSARAVDTVPTDLTDEICFHFSEPLSAINSETTTNTYVLAIGNGNYAQSLLMVINVVPWSSDAGIVINVTGGNPCGVAVYCNKQFNVSFSCYNYQGSRTGGNQYNSLSAGTTQILSFPSVSPAPTKCWYGNIPVNPMQSAMNYAPCFFIEDIVDAQGVMTGQNLYAMVSQFESEFYNELLPAISRLYTSVTTIQYTLSGVSDDVADISVLVNNMDGTLSTLSTTVSSLSSLLLSSFDTNGVYGFWWHTGTWGSGSIQPFTNGYFNIGKGLYGINQNLFYGLLGLHNDLTSLSSALSTAISNQTDTIMGQPVQVTQPSFSDSSSVESITDDYISDLDPSSALLQDVSTPLQGMNFWRDKVNELILTNNQMSVFILYILSIGLVVFFIGRRIRSE